MFLSITLAIFQFLLITFISINEFKRRSVSVFLWAMLFVVFGLMHCVTVLSSEYDYPMWVYDSASVFVISFCLIYMMTRSITMIRCKNSIDLYGDIRLSWERQSLSNRKYLYITFCLFVFLSSYQIYELISFSGSIFDTSWSSMREMNSNKDLGISQVIESFTYSTSIVLLFIYNKQIKKAYLSAFMILLLAIISRRRSDLLPLLIVMITYFVYQREKITVKRFAIFFLLGILSICAIYVLQIFRYYGSLYDFVSLFSIDDFSFRILSQVSEEKGDLWLKDYFYYFIYHNNAFVNFEEGHTYFRMLMVFLPTSIFGWIKPPDFAISMGSAIYPGTLGASIHPTLFGDCFANFGYWGVCMGLFWAIFVKLSDVLANRKNVYVKYSLIILYANAYILIGRGSVYNAFFTFMVGSIVVYAVWFVSHVKVNRI